MTLFAATGFLILGLSDLCVDLIWIVRTLWRRLTVYRRYARATAQTLERPASPGLIAVFVPAWREEEVIGDMLRHALRTFDHGDYRLYVGCYPNDPATIAAVRAVDDLRIRLVIGPVAGGTTKADCLNRLWGTLIEDERREGRCTKAVVLHDAEDVVHSAELRIFDRLIERFDMVQLPVLPLIDLKSRWIAGHYSDEFAEAHGKELVVREALGAALPSAGVGCAFSRNALGRIAVANGGTPFASESLTEDYELGLRLHEIEGRAAFVRLSAGQGQPVVVTRGYFPTTIETAVRQKSRWMVGIALTGWDRLGWSGGLAERWMRLRDRQSVLAAVLLFAGYVALLLWAMRGIFDLAGAKPPPPLSTAMEAILLVNLGLLMWRLAMRCAFVSQAYGWREGARSIPRVFVGNAIAMLAARSAIADYLAIRRTGEAKWDKTVHVFPEESPAE